MISLQHSPIPSYENYLFSPPYHPVRRKRVTTTAPRSARKLGPLFDKASPTHSTRRRTSGTDIYAPPSLDVRQESIRYMWTTTDLKTLRGAIEECGLRWKEIKTKFPHRDVKGLQYGYKTYLRKADNSDPCECETTIFFQNITLNSKGIYNWRNIATKINAKQNRLFEVRTASFVKEFFSNYKRKLLQNTPRDAIFNLHDSRKKMLTLSPLKASDT